MPTKDDLKSFIHDSPTPMNKREIARAFNVKGPDRTVLRKMLKQMAKDGLIEKTDSKSYAAPNSLPDSLLVEITDIDENGELTAKPVLSYGTETEPVIYIQEKKSAAIKSKTGDRLLVKVKRVEGNTYEGRILHNIKDNTDQRIVGIYKPYRKGGFVYPTDKKIKDDFLIPPEHCGEAREGDLVTIERVPAQMHYPSSKNPARVIDVLGNADDPKLISLIAIHSHSIPTVFPETVLTEAEALTEPDISDGRIDMRDIPLVTIDGEDARDFDDAVYAELDDHPKNEGGWKIIVAIADVSYYVRPNSVLDKEAYKRGNSTYFADRVVPMLPERLSNDLCSLRPHVNRACLAAQMVINKDAQLISYQFVRGLMRSAARLTYEQVEEAHRGNTDDITAPLMETVIQPLYRAYSLLKRAREKRGALELDLPERKAIIVNGQVKDIVPRKRLESHQLIEEFMILANVASAEMLEKKNAPCLYRVHDSPSMERLESARDVLKEAGYTLPKSDNVRPENINNILKLSTERGDAGLIHTLLLRTQSQAVYTPDNNGHFGLALEKYAHFTSPIRRYADLIVHRSLTKSLNLGKGGLSDHESTHLNDIAGHISDTERRSMIAERDVMDRFTAQYLSAHVGNIFKGHISSVTSFGIFVSLDDTGADGLVPMRYLPSDYYVFQEQHHRLVGRETGRSFRLSDAVMVKLLEADPLRGSTIFEIAEGDGNDASDSRRHDKFNRKRNAKNEKSSFEKSARHKNKKPPRRGKDAPPKKGGKGNGAHKKNK